MNRANMDALLSAHNYNKPYDISYSSDGKDLNFDEEFIALLDRYFAGEKEICFTRSQIKFIQNFTTYADTNIDNNDLAFSNLDQFLTTV